MSKSGGFSSAARAVREKNFRLYIVGHTVAWVGSWMFRMALSWVVWELTKSAAWLGAIAFINLIPSVVISPIAGAMADRMDRLRMLSSTQVVMIVHAVSLSALIYLDLVTIEVLAVFALVHGIVDSVQAPASHAIVPMLVPTGDLVAAYAINSTSFNVTRFVGPAITGVVITGWGSDVAIFCNAIGCLIFFVCIVRMEPLKSEVQSKHDRKMLDDLRNGFTYAARHRGIGPVMAVLIALSFLTFHLYQFMPAFADPIFHAGANGLAWLLAAMGIGAVLQGLVMVRRSGIEGMTGSIVFYIVMTGGAVIAVTATSIYWVGVVAMVVVGYFMSGTRLGAMTLIQHAVAGEMRGRVVSFYSTITHVCPACGALAVGLVAEWFGIRPTIAGCGLLAIGVGLWAARRHASIRDALEGPRGTVA